MELLWVDTRSEERAAIRYKGPQPINPNTASYDELRRLRGIGENYAKRIIERRPYHSIEALVTKTGIPHYVLERIRDHIALKPQSRHEHWNRSDEGAIRHQRENPGCAESGSREAMG